jgi:hypothetical protein
MLNNSSIHFIQQLERYGIIISDDEISSPAYGLTYNFSTYRFIRIKIIRHQHCLYKIVMGDGEYIQFGLLGRMEHAKKNQGNKRCVYSNSCFNCPLSDCVITQTDACVTNLLPFEMVENRWPKGTHRKESIYRKAKEREKEVAERRGRHTTNNK